MLSIKSQVGFVLEKGEKHGIRVERRHAEDALELDGQEVKDPRGVDAVHEDADEYHERDADGEEVQRHYGVRDDEQFPVRLKHPGLLYSQAYHSPRFGQSG